MCRIIIKNNRLINQFLFKEISAFPRRKRRSRWKYYWNSIPKSKYLRLPRAVRYATRVSQLRKETKKKVIKIPIDYLGRLVIRLRMLKDGEDLPFVMRCKSVIRMTLLTFDLNSVALRSINNYCWQDKLQNYQFATYNLDRTLLSLKINIVN